MRHRTARGRVAGCYKVSTGTAHRSSLRQRVPRIIDRRPVSTSDRSTQMSDRGHGIVPVANAALVLQIALALVMPNRPPSHALDIVSLHRVGTDVRFGLLAIRTLDGRCRARATPVARGRDCCVAHRVDHLSVVRCGG